MKFTKMHGAGNDFVLLNCMDQPDWNFNELAVKLCDRHFGIGADGLIVALPSETADIRYRIFNPDGSEPEMCGNGIRCFARFVYEEGILTKATMQVETLAGIIVPEIVFDAEGRIQGVKVDMGEPILERAQIPMVGDGGPVVGENLEVDGQSLRFTALSMGNPHCVIFVDDADQAPVTTLGPKVEVHPAFPKKTNVEFAQVVNGEEIIMRVWERGAGVTLACGTGACATLAAAVLNGKTGRKAKVRLLGGDLTIEWADNNRIYMTGPAVNVFRGNWLG